MATGRVDGLISGLDTTAIIRQLMTLERQPQARLEAKIKAHQTVISAYQSVSARFVALRDAADLVGRLSTWQATRASSSSEAVAATATGGVTGSLTFDVDQLAAAAAKVSSGTTSSTATLVADSSTLTITKGGTSVEVTLADRSLAGVVAAVNAHPSAGVKAAAVQVSPGVYKLQFTSTTTGAASEFSVDGLNSVLQAPGRDTLETLVDGADAQLTVGKGSAGEYQITSATNTVTGLLGGLTLTLKAKASGVTVDVTSDAEGIADKIQAMIDAANATLGEIAKQASYDPATKKAGPLFGDLTVRQLTQRVLGSVSRGIGLGGTGDLASVGIELTRTGQLTFDRARFLETYSTDPEQTAVRFRPGGTATSPSVTFLSALDTTRAGTYSVSITQAAEQARVDLGEAFSTPPVITVRVGNGAEVTYTAVSTDPQDLADELNAFLATQAMAATAVVDNGRLVLATRAYGSAAALTVSVNGGEPLTGTGADVAGTINGQAATGIGRFLTAPSSDPAAGGLTLAVAATPAEVAAAGGELDLGTFSYRPGFAQRLDSIGYGAVDRTVGSLTLAIQNRQSGIDSLNGQVAGWDVRLRLREDALRRQFAALETALGKLRDQSNWLAGQLAGLPTWSADQ